MASKTLVPLRASAKAAPVGAQPAGSIDQHEQITATIFLARKHELPADRVMHRLNRQEFAEKYGADPNDLAEVEKFAHQHGLKVLESDATKRRVVLQGTVAAMHAAFNVQLHPYRFASTGQICRCRTGLLSVPENLHSRILAVLGLDNRPQAKAHFRKLAATESSAGSFTPPQVALIYNFPADSTGAGQTIGIIELGGGYQTTDLTNYFGSLNLPVPSVASVSVDGGANTPGGDADDEVLLDIEVAGSIANGAKIAVYFAPNTDQGFIDAITDAVHDTTHKPSVISISWGGPEDSWTAQSQTAMNAALQDAAALGVTVTVAAGDNGSTDGESGALHVDFPASSPFALACGGTTLTASGNQIMNEVVWNETASNEGATGGGVSAVFALPTYQQSAGVPPLPTNQFLGRGVPDVAGNADPETGYQILVAGQNEVVGGTSAVAPLWAALVALLNQQLAANVGFLNPKLYTLGQAAFNDITSGNNDDGDLGYYSAGPGWDACTGFGSPDGQVLLDGLSISSTPGFGTSQGN